MIDFSSVLIQQLAIHRVGNQHKEEANFISETLTDLNEDMEEMPQEMEEVAVEAPQGLMAKEI